MKRVGVFGWGIVAPRSANVEAFARNLESSESWLAPFNGFGPDCFLVGRPDFNFADSFIVVGVALLILELLAAEGEKRASTEPGEHAP